MIIDIEYYWRLMDANGYLKVGMIMDIGYSWILINPWDVWGLTYTCGIMSMKP